MRFWYRLKALILLYLCAKFRTDWIDGGQDISFQRWGQKLGSRVGVWWGKFVLTPRFHGIWLFYGFWADSWYTLGPGVSGTGDFPIFYIYIRNNGICYIYRWYRLGEIYFFRILSWPHDPNDWLVCFLLWNWCFGAYFTMFYSYFLGLGLGSTWGH
jgi:hypothetical protein